MIVTRAPLRIPLGGGGTDFPSYYKEHGGYILGFACNLYVYVVLHPTIDGKIHLKHRENEVVDSPDELKHRIAAECIKSITKQYGDLGGIEIATFSDVPQSSGLGGSSAFCVALLAALYRFVGLKWDLHSLFKEAVEVERVNANQPGGMQDQWFAAYGNAFALTLSQSIHSEVMDLGGLVKNLKLVYTHEHRYNLDTATRQENLTSKGNFHMIQNLHSIKAIGKQIESLIKTGSFKEVGEAFSSHWEKKLLRDTGITTREIDDLYFKCIDRGAVGAKLIGLGGGGYLLVYTETELEEIKLLDLDIDTEGVKTLFESERIGVYA